MKYISKWVVYLDNCYSQIDCWEISLLCDWSLCWKRSDILCLIVKMNTLQSLQHRDYNTSIYIDHAPIFYLHEGWLTGPLTGKTAKEYENTSYVREMYRKHRYGNFSLKTRAPTNLFLYLILSVCTWSVHTFIFIT